MDCAALILVGLFKQWPNCMHGVKFCEIEFNEVEFNVLLYIYGKKLGCLLSRSTSLGIFYTKL